LSDFLRYFTIVNGRVKASIRHGLRGAEYAQTFHKAAFLELSDQEFELLYRACADHADGFTEADMTVQACWDADRLDLYRVGILPDPAFLLCTRAAKRPISANGPMHGRPHECCRIL
jgi:hypothetical protein